MQTLCQTTIIVRTAFHPPSKTQNADSFGCRMGLVWPGLDWYEIYWYQMIIRYEVGDINMMFSESYGLSCHFKDIKEIGCKQYLELPLIKTVFLHPMLFYSQSQYTHRKQNLLRQTKFFVTEFRGFYHLI